MAPSPLDASDRGGLDRYSAGWAAIMQLAREGRSWSGNERNNAYLNTGSGRFAAAARVTGLDLDDDARSIGFTDWDGDGDVDLWLRNRSGPRLRLMLNGSANPRSLVIKLQGTTSNRDAIGARVSVQIDGQPPMIKSLRAGDLFLSQSSKRLHFGLAGTGGDPRVSVRWPGGAEESFGRMAAGGRHLLVEGSGAASAIDARREVELPVAGLPHPAPHSGARILLPARVPLPPCEFTDVTGQRRQLLCDAPTLLLLWSADCDHCRAELGELARRSGAVKSAGIRVVALSVDAELEAPVGDFPFQWGRVTEASMQRVHHLQAALFDQGVPPVVPLSFLLTADTEVAAIYRGQFGVDTLLADAKLLAETNPVVLRNHPLPFPGRWYTTPATRGQVLNIVGRRFQARYPETSLFYLGLASESITGPRRDALRAEIARKHRTLAIRARDARDLRRAERHFSLAIRFAPAAAELRNDLGALLASTGRLAEARGHFQTALELKPDFELARRNLERATELMERQ